MPETNEKFNELPEEKRQKIINAGFEVFATSDYKHASTEDIATKAGISKGLLFYYFHDKRSLYLFLYDYAVEMTMETVMDDGYVKIRDVFEMLDYAARRKYALLEKNPFIMDFVMRAYYSDKEAVSEELNKRLERITAEVYGTYFSRLDFSKFREGVDPLEIVQMLIWMADGYLHEQQRQNKPIELDDLMEKHWKWSELFKRISYKEEYLK